MNIIRKIITVSATVAAVLAAAPTYSHGIWFAERSRQLAIIYGAGTDDLDTIARFDKFVGIKGYDHSWHEVDARLIKAGPMVLVGGDDYPEAVSAVMDNGVWSRTNDGKWHAKGRDEVPEAVVAERTMKYAVHIRGVPRAVPVLPSQTLQIIPVDGAPAMKDGKYDLHSDSMPAQAGDMIRVKVLFNGKPAQGARVVTDFVNLPDQYPMVTGEDGTVYFPVRNQGLNVIGATFDGPSDDRTRIDKIEHFATLSFVLEHLPE